MIKEEYFEYEPPVLSVPAKMHDIGQGASCVDYESTTEDVCSDGIEDPFGF